MSTATPLSEDKEDFLPAPVRRLAPYLLLILAVFAVYGNVYDNSFVFDDDLLIQLNTYLFDWHHIGAILVGSTTSGVHIAGGFYRPMQMLLYLVVNQLFGQSLFWFHLLNITLHAANTCFMYRLGTRLNFKPTAIFTASLLWAIHPLHTEAITYMSATADPLFAFFCLWAINVLLPDITQHKIFAVIPLMLLGIASKETTVMFPLLVIACLFYVGPQRLNIRTYLRTWPLWIISLSYVAWRMQAQGFDGPQTYNRYYGLHEFANLRMYAQYPLCRIYTFLATLPFYLQLFFWPYGLHMERAFSIFTSIFFGPVLVGLALVIASAALLVFSARKGKYLPLAWGLLWFIGAHAPDTGILIPMNSLFLEHWMYLPSVGLFLGTAETVAHLLQGKPRLTYATCAVTFAFALFLSARTYAQNEVWKTPESFYKNIFAYGERSARSRNNLALYYTAEGRFADGIDQFNEAVAISDTYAETRYNMAIAYLNLPDQSMGTPKAIENLNRSIELDPKFFRSYELMSEIYTKLLHDPEKADYYSHKAAELTPQQ